MSFHSQFRSSWPSNLTAVWVCSLGILCLAEMGALAQSNQVEAVSAKTAGPVVTNALPPGDPLSFKIIADRNIFNPNRAARSSRSDSEPKKAVKVDVLSLVGTLASEKGTFAFFEGSSSEFKKVLQMDAQIAGYRLTAIEDTAVKLTAGDQTLRLVVGGQLRRKEDGPWEAGEAGATVPDPNETTSVSPATESTASSAGSAGGDGDILERLRKKREQEMKNEKP